LQSPPLFSDNGVTPQANPYTANSFGFGYFYAPDGCFNVQLSGGSAPSIPSPYTYGDVCTVSGSGGGGGGGGGSTGWDTMTISGGTVTPNYASGAIHEVVLTASPVNVNAISGTVPAGASYDIVLTQDSTGGRQVTWDSSYHGLTGWEISTAASTYSVFTFAMDPSGYSVLKHAGTGRIPR
jgi:hypothetical protein